MLLSVFLASDPREGLGLFGLLLVLYFVPSAVAWNKRNFAAVCALNFFLGWTLIGWVVALAWALTNDPKPVIIQQSPSAPSANLPSELCPACGKYSQWGSRFCANCGKPFVSAVSA
jgi:hypothetical protein